MKTQEGFQRSSDIKVINHSSHHRDSTSKKKKKNAGCGDDGGLGAEDCKSL